MEKKEFSYKMVILYTWKESVKEKAIQSDLENAQEK